MKSITYFKQCSSCGKKWETLASFKEETETVAITDYLAGLSLVNCPCGTTLAIDALVLYPDKRDELIKLWKTDQKYKMVPILREKQKLIPIA